MVRILLGKPATEGSGVEREVRGDLRSTPQEVRLQKSVRRRVQCPDGAETAQRQPSQPDDEPRHVENRVGHGVVVPVERDGPACRHDELMVRKAAVARALPDVADPWDGELQPPAQLARLGGYPATPA